MTKNIIITLLSLLLIIGVVFGAYEYNSNDTSRQLEELDEQIMELQYQIDKAQDDYASCENILSTAHDTAEENRAKIEELNQQKAILVGLIQE